MISIINYSEEVVIQNMYLFIIYLLMTLMGSDQDNFWLFVSKNQMVLKNNFLWRYQQALVGLAINCISLFKNLFKFLNEAHTFKFL